MKRFIYCKVYFRDMHNKKFGLILLLLSIFFSIVIIVFNLQINNLIQNLITATGNNCIISGLCVQDNLLLNISFIVILLTFILSIYAIFFEIDIKYFETYKGVVPEAEKKSDNIKSELNDEEKKILETIKEQNGIEQPVLRIKTNLSRTKLSILLKELDQKGIIRKELSGRKNKIYIKDSGIAI